MKKEKGFTMVELVIVIAVTIILSLVSVPIYKDYVLKARLTEGYALLGAIKDAQQLYYSDHEYFFKDMPETNYDPVLDVDARGNQYFTKFRSGYLTNSRTKVYHFIVYSKDNGSITHIWSPTGASDIWNY